MKTLTKILATAVLTAGMTGITCSKTGDSTLEANKPDTTKVVNLEPMVIEKPKTPIELAFEQGCYVIKPGEGLYDIAEKLYGEKTMAHAIADWNGYEMEPYGGLFVEKPRIQPGHGLDIWEVELKKVKYGDTYQSLADSTGMTVDEFQKKFHWIGAKPTPGEVYYLEK